MTSAVATSVGGAIAALDIVDASKTFGPTTVLNGVTLTIAPGEIHALVGENGSGKSTLVKILAGYHTPDPGTTIAVAGTPVTKHHPDVSDQAGLRFVHQDLGLVGSLNAVENLGLEPATEFGAQRRFAGAVGARPPETYSPRSDAPSTSTYPCNS